MKNILITGINSYIGTSLEKKLEKDAAKYYFKKVNLRDTKWKSEDFSKFDVVVHVAGIAHIKENEKNKELYYKINKNLTYEVAKKSKLDGVKHFVFLSSMSVYGVENGMIDADTPPNPNTHYGKSKFQAEELVNKLADDSFKVAILRPPMIYGRGCKGNYARLANLAVRIPVFPDIDNKRSMIYIDNLLEFIKQIIDDSSSGLFFPQNSEYVKTSEMVRLIAEAHGKKIVMTKLFNPILELLNIRTLNKVFGDLVYVQDQSNYRREYNLYGLRESILLTEMEQNL